MSSGRLLARNALINLAGQGAPLLLAVVTIPLLISGLGADRFAILALAWTAIGYFSVADLGLAAALTQAIASRLGRAGRDELGAVSWTALTMMFGLGVVGALLLAALAPWLIGSLLRVPQALQRESVAAFLLIALSLPFLVTAAGLRGIVEAHQQFGTSTLLRLPFAIFTFVGPLLVLQVTTSLVPVVGVIVAGRILTWAGFLVVCLRRFGFLRGPMGVRRSEVAPLLRFGGWLTLSNVLSPIMVNLDRFVIGAILPLVAVAHYVTASEVVIKLFIIPIALNAVFFPAMANAFATDEALAGRMFERGLRIGMLAVFPLVLTLVTFAYEGLDLWVGAEFAIAGESVLRWLAAAILVTSPGQLAYLMLHARGRTDRSARAHMIELPVYALLVWVLASSFGIRGVAIAWFLRIALDSSLMLWMARGMVAASRAELTKVAMIGGALLATVAAGGAMWSLQSRAIFWLAAMAAFIIVTWRHLLAPSERALLRSFTGGARAATM